MSNQQFGLAFSRSDDENNVLGFYLSGNIDYLQRHEGLINYLAPFLVIDLNNTSSEEQDISILVNCRKELHEAFQALKSGKGFNGQYVSVSRKVRLLKFDGNL